MFGNGRIVWRNKAYSVPLRISGDGYALGGCSKPGKAGTTPTIKSSLVSGLSPWGRTRLGIEELLNDIGSVSSPINKALNTAAMDLLRVTVLLTALNPYCTSSTSTWTDLILDDGGCSLIPVCSGPHSPSSC